VSSLCGAQTCTDPKFNAFLLELELYGLDAPCYIEACKTLRPHERRHPGPKYRMLRRLLNSKPRALLLQTQAGQHPHRFLLRPECVYIV
jgi:hypothetical protein